MTFAGKSISNFAGAMGRSLRTIRAPHEIVDTEFDPFERKPVMRSDIQEMLSVDLPAEKTEEPVVEVLRASEKREHDTMCQIRGALYPVDQV